MTTSFQASPDKVLLDECLPLRGCRVLADLLQLHRPPYEAVHLNDYLNSGTLDQDWTERLAKESGWLVISADHGKMRGSRARLKGPPLHLLCPARKITAFFIVGKYAQRPGFDKIQTIVAVWPRIVAMSANAPAGTRFRIKQSGHGFSVTEWPLGAGEVLPQLNNPDNEYPEDLFSE